MHACMHACRTYKLPHIHVYHTQVYVPLADLFVGLLFGCLVVWLLGCLTSWLVSWLVGWLVT